MSRGVTVCGGYVCIWVGGGPSVCVCRSREGCGGGHGVCMYRGGGVWGCLSMCVGCVCV